MSGPGGTMQPRVIGEVLHGTYRIERHVGEGGMGAVYEVSHQRIPRRFALKVLSTRVSRMPSVIARFRREAEIASAVRHPHVVEVIDFNETADGAPYIVMELLDGEDLGKRIARLGQLDLASVVTILEQLAGALHAVHQQGVVHRDLKPENVFLCRTPTGHDFVKVVDFGISKISGAQLGITQSNAVMGTPAYMSPEQAMGDTSSVDVRTDVYATGAILYEMLAGHPPLTADSIPALMLKIVSRLPPPLRSLRPDLGAGIEAVVHRALAKAPADRPASMAELWADFAAAAGDVAAAPKTAARFVIGPATQVDGLAATQVSSRPEADLERVAPAPLDEVLAGRTAHVHDTTPGPGADLELPRPRSTARPLRWIAAGLLFAAAAAAAAAWSRNRGEVEEPLAPALEAHVPSFSHERLAPTAPPEAGTPALPALHQSRTRDDARAARSKAAPLAGRERTLPEVEGSAPPPPLPAPRSSEREGPATKAKPRLLRDGLMDF